ncbi:MAG: hypothetical protein ACI9EF_000769 [Pseudohongiellaceae bacterium]|jgi:hypothetical protein
MRRATQLQTRSLSQTKSTWAATLLGLALVMVQANTLVAQSEELGDGTPASDGVYALIELDQLETFDWDHPEDPASADFQRALVTASQNPLLLSPARHQPRAFLSGPGEAVIRGPSTVVRSSLDPFPPASLAVRLSEPRDLTGQLRLPSEKAADGPLAAGFRISADQFSQVARRPYWNAVATSAELQLSARHSGAAWFRHVRDSARTAAGEKTARKDAPAARRTPGGFSTAQQSLNMLSGGRALSENLALDRRLPVAAHGDNSVAMDSIQGVTVSPYDWDALLAEIEDDSDIALDTLAAMIPSDQHALFFPTYETMVALSDATDELAEPLLVLFESRSQHAHTRQRYEQQLGLSMSALSRLLGPKVIASVAITGGDTYLRTGSDIALLFEAKIPLATVAAITARVRLSFAGRDDVQELSGTIEGIAYTGLHSDDRSACSYIATLGPAVVVTNSLEQLSRLARAASGAVTTLAELPEYRWFRHRYPMDTPDPSALLVLSDDTIRRWCGPRLRIGSSRRARAAAVLSELTARRVNATTSAHPGPENPPLALADLGAITQREQISSANFGDLTFATPISELDLDFVSEEEEALYDLWLADYERNWREVFDPIAVQLSVTADGLAVDTTIRPLALNSDYDRFADLSRGSQLKPTAGDPHPEALAHFAVALDKRQLNFVPEIDLVKTLVPGVDIFGWIGGSVSFYIDNTDYFSDSGANGNAEGEVESYLFSSLDRLPVAIQAEVGSTLKLVLFLTGIRGFIESTAPGDTAWETRKHLDQPYVRVSEGTNRTLDSNLALYYTSGPEGLTLSLSEELIWRVIERRLQRATAAPALNEGTEWIGDHIALRLDRSYLTVALQFFGDDFHRRRQQACLKNLPILTVWQQRFPGEAPVAVHQRLFRRTLRCPNGGAYRHNDAYQTVECSSHGHLARPLTNTILPAALQTFGSLMAGLTFEDDGIRARVQLTRQSGEH